MSLQSAVHVIAYEDLFQVTGDPEGQAVVVGIMVAGSQVQFGHVLLMHRSTALWGVAW